MKSCVWDRTRANTPPCRVCANTSASCLTCIASSVLPVRRHRPHSRFARLQAMLIVSFPLVDGEKEEVRTVEVRSWNHSV